MASDNSKSTSGIVTSDSVLAAASRNSKMPSRKVLVAALIVTLACLLGFGVYTYNTSYKRTTAKGAQQVISKLKSTLPEGKTKQGVGAVLSAHKPQGFTFSVKPAAARVVEYTVVPNELEKTYNQIHHVLSYQGLSKKNISNSKTTFITDAYYDNAYVHCRVSVARPTSNFALQVACADVGAYTSSAKQMQKFHELYAKNNPHKAAASSIESIDIKDSVSMGYKIAELTIIRDNTPEGAVNALYYQTPDGTWNYFKATLLEIYCEEYNTPDLKKAFIGKKCFTTSGSISSVRP